MVAGRVTLRYITRLSLSAAFLHWLGYAKPEPEEIKGGRGKAKSWRGTKDIKVFIIKSSLTIQQLVHRVLGMRDKV